MSADYPSRSLDKIVVRVPDGMRDQLAELARGNGRSMNAEIVARLQRSIELSNLVHPSEIEDLPTAQREDLFIKSQEIAAEIAAIQKKMRETFGYQKIDPERKSKISENVAQSLGRKRALGSDDKPED